jgi:methionyl-tRNA formyltransferase
MDLVFLGTPAFAVPSLRALVAGRHRVCGVVTNPARPKGRGQRLAATPVQAAAEELGLPVLTPASVRQPELADRLASWAPELFVVVAFSILPRRLLRVPPRGAVNLHPSMLPAYRGAAPIAWSVINGEHQTGLTTFLLNERVDAGDLLLQVPVTIADGETAGELEARLAVAGAEVLVRTVDGLADGTLTPRPQPAGQVTGAPKLSRHDGWLDWSQPAAALRQRILGTNPVPGACTVWAGREVKILRAQCCQGQATAAPGTVLVADPRRGPIVAAGSGALLLTQVQPAGGRAMDGSAFVRGYGIQPGLRFGPAAG